MRYPLHLPVRYRADDGPWHQGTTENISRSGVLLRADEPVVPDAEVELVVELPPVEAGHESAEVLCHGRVLRAARPEDNGEGALVAASIEWYRLRRRSTFP